MRQRRGPADAPDRVPDRVGLEKRWTCGSPCNGAASPAEIALERPYAGCGGRRPIARPGQVTEEVRLLSSRDAACRVSAEDTSSARPHTSSSESCQGLPPPATGARGESTVALPRGSERVRSRSAARECSQPRAAFLAVRAPPRTIPARAVGKHIFRESALPVAECLRSGRARAEFRWGRPKAGSTNLRETFPRELGTTGARWWQRRRGHLRARLPRSPGAAILSAPGSGAAWAGGLAASRRFRRGTVCLPDRKSTRLNSSHANISYAVFCLKK